MVDVSDKAATARIAVARGYVSAPDHVIARVKAGGVGKGDVLAIAELAGIMGAKRTSDLIPLCHPIALTAVGVRIAVEEAGFAIEAEVHTTGRTGVEMEAMTAVSIAALTIYDMLKSLAREIRIERIELIEKSGGESGLWQRGDDLDLGR